MKVFPMPPMCPTTHSLTCRDERRLRKHDALEWSTNVVVTAVIPELEMVVAQAESQGIEVHLTDPVPRVRWKEFCMGQHLRVKLIGILAPRMVSVEIA